MNHLIFLRVCTLTDPVNQTLRGDVSGDSDDDIITLHQEANTLALKVRHVEGLPNVSIFRHILCHPDFVSSSYRNDIMKI